MTRRATPDAYGRGVDRYVEDQRVCVLIARRPDAGWSERAATACRALVGLVSSHPVARIRSLRFTMFLCGWRNIHGDDLVAVALPDKIGLRVFNLLYLDLLGGYDEVEVDYGTLNDVRGLPWYRYERGLGILYVGLGDTTPDQLDGFVCRSYELYSTTRRTVAAVLPQIRDEPPARHSLPVWEAMQLDVLRFFHDIELPSTYARLKGAAERQFGLTVREVPRSRIGHHGRITVDWLSDDVGSCGVLVEVARELPAPLRYVVLAHEIAHYALHFPFLVAVQAVEQISWLVPAAETRFTDHVQRVLPDRELLEDAADELSSYAVLPRFLDQGSFDHILDVDRTPTAPQMMWAGMQDFFPDTREIEDFRTHRTREAMLARERADLDRAERAAAQRRGIYDVVLAAALRRRYDRCAPRNHRVGAAIEQIVVYVQQALLTDVEPVGRGAELPTPAVASQELSSRRWILPPLRAGARDPADVLRWPVVPDDRDGELCRAVLDPEHRPLAAEDWRALRPHLAVVVYPDKRLPELPVAAFFR